MLTTAKELLIEAATKGITDEAICTAVGVHTTTLWRWRQGMNPRFEQLNKLHGLVKGAVGG